MGATRELARFVAETSFADLPADVVEVAQLSSLNIAGTCLGGFQTRLGRLHVELAQELGGGNPEATIAGAGTRVSAPLAAYANASLGFALDYEDMLYYVVHPGFATVAAGLAVGELVGASGRDFLAAVVLGYEVAGRIGVAVQPTAERGREVWGEVYHSFAAAVTAAKLLGLDEEQTDVALGIAGTYSPLPSVYKYFGPIAETRPMREVKQGWGWMCLAGVVGALSARRGFGGGHGFLDGRHGFWIMAGSDRCDFERLVEGLGERWLTRDTEYKIHPSMGGNHPAFWATRGLVEQHGIRPEDVGRIRLTTFMADKIGDLAPAGEVDAQFSLPYTVATTIMREPLGPGLYSPEMISDPVVRRLLARTEVIQDDAAERAFFDEQRIVQTVQIELVDGRLLRRDIEFPRDRPGYGRPEVEQKFADLACGVLDEERRAAVVRLVDALPGLADVGELAAALH